MENHRESRKRLRPWLERMINSGDCPGLVWENRDERTFRIPWRHFNNKEWVEEDSKIFREWAKYTGKYQDGDKVEYPVWKTRLRCALKKIPEIKEIPEMHRIEDANPYRVYKFVDVMTPIKRCFEDFEDSNQSQCSTTSSHLGRDFLIEEQSVSPQPPNFLRRDDQTVNIPKVVYDDDIDIYGRLNEKKEPGHFLTNYPDGKDHVTAFQSGSPHNYVEAASLNPLRPENSLSSNEPMTSLPSDLISLETSDLCVLDGMELPNSMTSLTNHSNLSIEMQPQNVSIPESLQTTYIPSMHVSVFYGAPTMQVLSETVQSPGCRFFSPCNSHVNVDSNLEETLFGPKNVFQIPLPSADRVIADNEQKRLISDLLDKMERGVVLTYHDSDIFVQRLCRTRVYLTDGSTVSSQLDRKIQTPIKAFDYKLFYKEYQEYQNGLKKDSPKPFFILTLGQEIRKSHFTPMHNILIYVVVRHDLATKLISQDPHTNSSSGSFYSFDSYDKFLEEIKKVRL